MNLFYVTTCIYSTAFLKKRCKSIIKSLKFVNFALSFFDSLKKNILFKKSEANWLYLYQSFRIKFIITQTNS